KIKLRKLTEIDFPNLKPQTFSYFSLFKKFEKPFIKLVKMKKHLSIFASFLLFFSFSVNAQEKESETRQKSHANENPFRQLYQEFATPNQYRTASGAPGPAYYQNTADYVMEIKLDDKNQRLHG